VAVSPDRRFASSRDVRFDGVISDALLRLPRLASSLSHGVVVVVLVVGL
jgi:hypothetical protein